MPVTVQSIGSWSWASVTTRSPASMWPLTREHGVGRRRRPPPAPPRGSPPSSPSRARRRRRRRGCPAGRGRSTSSRPGRSPGRSPCATTSPVVHVEDDGRGPGRGAVGAGLGQPLLGHVLQVLVEGEVSRCRRRWPAWTRRCPTGSGCRRCPPRPGAGPACRPARPGRSARCRPGRRPRGRRSRPPGRRRCRPGTAAPGRPRRGRPESSSASIASSVSGEHLGGEDDVAAVLRQLLGQLAPRGRRAAGQRHRRARRVVDHRRVGHHAGGRDGVGERVAVAVEHRAAQRGDGIGAQPVLLGGVGVGRAVDALEHGQPADDEHQQRDHEDQAPAVAQPRWSIDSPAPLRRLPGGAAGGERARVARPPDGRCPGVRAIVRPVARGLPRPGPCWAPVSHRPGLGGGVGGRLGGAAQRGRCRRGRSRGRRPGRPGPGRRPRRRSRSGPACCRRPPAARGAAPPGRARRSPPAAGWP